MENVFIVYRTDTWHSYKSRDIIGIATSKSKAVDIVIAAVKKEGHKIKKKSDAYFELTTLNQTQSYKGEGEFVIEPVQIDCLI